MPLSNKRSLEINVIEHDSDMDSDIDIIESHNWKNWHMMADFKLSVAVIRKKWNEFGSDFVRS